MTGDEGRQVVEAMLPQEELDRLCAAVGAIERPRQLHRGMCVRAMVLSAGTPGGASQAEAWRSDLECAVPSGARSAGYRWFDAPLERCMEALAQRALAYAQAQHRALSGPLRGVTDWSLVEATTVTVRDARREEFPGTGADAALKGHKVRSVGCGAPGRDHFSPAREPDSRQLTIDEAGRDWGLRADRASARLDRLRACEAPGVRFVIRLQDHGPPTVAHLARGPVAPEVWPGTALDVLGADKVLLLDGRAMDADVHGGPGQEAVPLRLVGVQPPNGHGGVLTTLPPRIGPRQGAALYRGRWEVARSITVDTSVNRLDAMDAERPCSLKTLLQAARIASTIAALLAPTPHLPTRPQQPGAPRMEAPLPPRRGALPRAVSCPSMAQAFDLKGDEAQQRGDTLAAILSPSGKDPTGRRRPAVFDQLRGWKRQPMARQETTNGEVSHGTLKAAA
jgi:hypothetical protein